MNDAARTRLLDLNRRFYASVADDFHETRLGAQPGLLRALDSLPRRNALRLLDAGCGNGRFAHVLNDAAIDARYTGVDGSAELLALATSHARDLPRVDVRFVYADFAAPGWSTPLAAGAFDAVVCFATLHHIPSFALRQRIVCDLAALLIAREDARLILSCWQPLNSPRIAAKQLPWSTIGLSERDVDAGDLLLPWDRGARALRYVHQIDEAEIQRLAAGAGLCATETFLADGKAGDLGLYAVLRRTDD